LNIVHYLGNLKFGGIERLTKDLIVNQLKNTELNPSLIVGQLIGEYKEDFLDLNIKIHNVNITSGFELSPLKLKHLKNIFRNNDIIHLHGFNPIVVFAALLSKKKLVYTEHGNFGFGRDLRLRDRSNFSLRKQFFKLTKLKVICNSKFTYEVLNGIFKVPENQLQIIYNGSNFEHSIETTFFKSERIVERTDFRIGTAARLVGFKKIERLIKVFSKFLILHPDSKLVILGEGPEKKMLEKISAELNLKDNLIFEGYRDNILDYFKSFDVCVFPSENEPFGLVAIEAYSVNKPVLVFKDGGGLTEIVERFNTDDICEDADKMLERLEYYYNNKNQIYNTKNVTEFFSAARMEKEYFAEYKRLLECAE